MRRREESCNLQKGNGLVKLPKSFKLCGVGVGGVALRKIVHLATKIIYMELSKTLSSEAACKEC
jgi:hypothetical protein